MDHAAESVVNFLSAAAIWQRRLYVGAQDLHARLASGDALTRIALGPGHRVYAPDGAILVQGIASLWLSSEVRFSGWSIDFVVAAIWDRELWLIRSSLAHSAESDELDTKLWANDPMRADTYETVLAAMDMATQQVVAAADSVAWDIVVATYAG